MAVPSFTSSVRVTVQPFSAAMARQVSTSSWAGNSAFGAQAVKLRPILAQATIRELPMLLRASPM